MPTQYFDSPHEAARLVREGGCVAFPTETVYGLGADARNADAIARVFEAKGRPSDNPLIVHLPDLAAIGEVVTHIPATARALMDAFFPGPLTLVLERHPSLPAVVSAGLDTVGVRVPVLPLAQTFLRACGVPVAAPSANVSGRPSPTTWHAVAHDLDGRIDGILRGPQATRGLESTVVDCTGAYPLVLRPGVVTLEQLQEVVPATSLPSSRTVELARSPGTRHRHYAPRARVVLGMPDTPELTTVGWIGLGEAPAHVHFEAVCACASLEAYAHELYAFFRQCDDEGIETIYCAPVPETDLGRALADRLRRAAAR